MNKKQETMRWIPWIVAGAFLVVGMATLGDYGINWDGAYRMMRGQAFAQYLLMGERKYGLPERVSPLLFDPGEYVTRYDFLAGEGDQPAKLPERPLPRSEFEALLRPAEPDYGGQRRISFYQDEAWNGEYFVNYDEPGHPPLPDIIGALFNRWLWQGWGWLGDIDSYKVFAVIAAAIGVFAVAAFVLDLTGSRVASLVAGLALGLWPIYWAEAHFNMKDPAQAAMYAGSVWAFWRWVKENKWWWWVAFTGFATMAVNIKWNIVVGLPVILLAWLILIRKTAEFKRWWQPAKLIVFSLLTLVVSLSVMVAMWPAAWSNPVGWIGQVAGFYKGFGLSQDHLQPDGWFWGLNWYPLALTLAQAPEIVLILAVLGVFWLGPSFVRLSRTSAGEGGSENLKVKWLVGLWVLVPMARQMLPWVKSYSGMRQMMEVIPAMAVLAGIGASQISQKLKVKAQKYNLKVKSFEFLIVVLTFTFLVLPLIGLHPNENVYFNRLVGGLKGAKDKNLIDLMITYGNVYKQGVKWLNTQAESNANLAVLDGYSFAVSPVWLREDISISPEYFSGFEQKGEYFMVLYRPNDQAVFAQMYPQRLLEPVYEVKVDDVGLLKIYKNEKMKLKEEKVDFKVRGGEVELDLEVGITRLVVTQIRSDCQAENSSAFVDELVEFRDEEGQRTVYGLMERRRQDDRVEWWFPGERAVKIRIYPQSEVSCFNSGKLVEVWGVRSDEMDN